MKVFVHGVPESAAIWQLLVESLAERGVTDVVLLSPPGFGAPTPDGWTATAADYRTWLIGELEALGGAVDLVGHDWGAGHVFGLLAERPDLVRTWASDCAGLLHPDYVWHDTAQAWQTPELGEQVVDAIMGMSADDKLAFLVGLDFTPELAAPVAAAMDAEMGRCILALYRSAAQPALQELGRRLTGATLPPGLVVIAPGDTYAGTTAQMGEMATALGASTATLDGTGHWWMIQRPDAAAAALVQHWT